MAVKASATITLTSYRDTQSVTRYYKLQPAGSSAPLKPDTKPPSSDWTDSEPACDISKELYFCDLTIFSNGEGEYSKVSKSTSYEAAKQAYNKANAAKDSIDNLEIGGRNYIVKTDSSSITKNGITLDYDGEVYHIYGTNTKTDAAYGIGGNFIEKPTGLEPNVVYTVSTTTPIPSGLYFGINTRNSSGTGIQAGSNSYLYGDGNKTSTTFTCTQDTNGTLILFFGVRANCGTVDVTFKIKLEKGNKATDWTPAPEDVDEDIDNVWEKADDAQTSIDKLEIGGRNLAKRENIIAYDTSFSKIDGYEYTQLVGNGAGIKFPASMFTEDTEYVLSFKFQKVSGTLTSIAGHSTSFETRNVVINGESFSQGWTTTHEIEDSEAIQTCVVYLRRYTASENPSTDNNLYIQPERSRYHTSNDITIKYWDIKIEKGNKATDWTPAPEDIESRTTVLEAASAKELVRNGFAEFTNDPKLTLGKTTSPWKVVVKNDGIFLQKSSNDVASLSKETSSEETTLRADNARLANVKFRSANGGGKLGIVAQSNGHVSLKEI